MEKIIFCLLGISCATTISSCKDDLQEEGECHAFYTLVNKSDYDVKLNYFEHGLYTGNVQYDILIKRDSSYTMEVIWDILGPPFHFIDTIHVSFVEALEFEDYKENSWFNTVMFSKSYNYTVIDNTDYIRKSTYTITNADYEYAKQKLAEREADNGRK
ncbi:MAG: hypothetical protein J6Y37_14580 [Paludibacteraceae bacterium]|nr:hypothetical protein [Paludibacteraceae bacterium]